MPRKLTAPIRLVAIAFFTLAIFAANLFAQPSKNLPPCETVDEYGTNYPEKTVCYLLPAGIRFKVQFDTAVNSGSNKRNDWVRFTVLDNVYGIKTGNLGDPGNSPARRPFSAPTPTPSLQKPAGGCPQNEQQPLCCCPEDRKKDPDIPEFLPVRYVVIPAGTKGYARVNWAKRRTPFYARGKAKILVIFSSVRLESGDDILIKLSDSATSPITYENIRTCKKLDATGKKLIEDKDNFCISGRRPHVPFVVSVFSAIAATILAVKKDSLAAPLAAITLVNNTASGQGIGDFINGQNAEVSKDLIFEVETTKDKTGHILPPPPK